ncbi:hypothetical protein [Streptomyces kurssanovii]|uniref:Uncharacterized protein n=1 Tax=Streptomyces kurssanovii TaxID=67312 RepID=A0ABV3I3P1_9ACTN
MSAVAKAQTARATMAAAAVGGRGQGTAAPSSSRPVTVAARSPRPP